MREAGIRLFALYSIPALLYARLCATHIIVIPLARDPLLFAVRRPRRCCAQMRGLYTAVKDSTTLH